MIDDDRYGVQFDQPLNVTPQDPTVLSWYLACLLAIGRYDMSTHTHRESYTKLAKDFFREYVGESGCAWYAHWYVRWEAEEASVQGQSARAVS